MDLLRLFLDVSSKTKMVTMVVIVVVVDDDDDADEVAISSSEGEVGSGRRQSKIFF